MREPNKSQDPVQRNASSYSRSLLLEQEINRSNITWKSNAARIYEDGSAEVGEFQLSHLYS